MQCISVADRSQGLDHQGVNAEEQLDPINKVLARGHGLVGFISEFWTILRRNWGGDWDCVWTAFGKGWKVYV